MNDFDLMERFRDDMPPADPAALARARARMFRAPAASRGRRWAWGLVPAGALAAAVAVASFAARPAGPAPGAGTTPGGSSPVAVSEAAQVLRLAAAEARQEPELKARPGQFVYVKSRVAGAGLSVAAPSATATYKPPVEKIRWVWLSADGSQAGLLKVRLAKGGEVQTYPLWNEDAPDVRLPPAYRGDLPTDATAMRAYLYAIEAKKSEIGTDTMAFTKVGDTLREEYVPPRSVAALFEAAATIPGTTLKKRVDLAGRAGIAVCRGEGGLSHELIFDASTHKYLGERTVAVDAPAPYPKNAVTNWTAQLEVAIVDRPGQLP